VVIEHVARRLADIKRTRGIGVVAPVDAADIDVEMKPMPSRRLSMGKVRMSVAQVTKRHITRSLGVSNMMKSS
jgi:hypothetical protein